MVVWVNLWHRGVRETVNCVAVVDDVILPTSVNEVKVVYREQGLCLALSGWRAVFNVARLVSKCHQARGIPYCPPDSAYNRYHKLDIMTNAEGGCVTCSRHGGSGSVRHLPQDLVLPVFLGYHQKCIFWRIFTFDLNFVCFILHFGLKIDVHRY